MSEPLPKHIGRFQVQSELGRGGFGRVFKAFDPTVSRLVAVKILTEGGKDILTRFRNEATVAGNLRHENIVTVYEYGEHEGKPFLAMEFLEGEDLQQILTSRRTLTLLQKCQIMWQVAEGLSCAHRNGVVHRDVKPANIMVLADGSIKIMDFGIARVLRDAGGTRLTKEGHMIGTLLYMAPEQLNGSEADVLCDIFAYGAIYYELLAGRHPFAAADARALMYKISFEDPAPLLSVKPDLPEGLQNVIGRLLNKVRELRYQNLREVQLDVSPILMGLRHNHAAALTGKAQQLYDTGQFESAQSLVLEILSLDPGDRVARALWENLQQQIRLRSVRPRIESLLKAGQELLEQRRFGEALQNFESARRLDPENNAIQSQIELTRTRLEGAKKAATLLLSARRDLERQDYAAAHKSITEALQTDPQNTEAAALMQTLQDAIEHQERERLVDEAMAKVDALLALRSYDEALELLMGLGSETGNPKVAKLLNLVRSEKESYEREQRLHSELSAVTGLLRENRFQEAVRSLDALQRDFPENDEVRQLHAYTQRELAAQQRIQGVLNVAAEAEGLLRAREFDRALEMIEQGLRKYPGEPRLIRLLGGSIAAKADWECQQAVNTTLEKCTQLRAEQRFGEAVAVVEATLREYSGEARLLDLLRELEAELAEQRRLQAIQSACAEGRKLLQQGQPKKAVQLIRQALVRYPNEGPLSEILVEAQNVLREQERAQALEAIGRDVAACLGANDFAGALNLLDRGLQAWPGEAVLLRQQESTRAKQADFERQRAVQETIRQASLLASEQKYGEALKLLEDELGKYPGESSLERLKTQLAARWEEIQRREAVRKIAEQAQSMMSGARLEDAIRFLHENVRVYAGESDLQSLLSRAQRELQLRQRAAAVARLITDVRALTAGEEFDRAQAMLEQGVAQYSADPALANELESVRQARAAWQRRRAIEEVLRQATQWAGEKRYADALRIVDRSLKDYDKDPTLLDLQRTIQRQWEEDKRREAVSKAAADAAVLLDRNQPDLAVRLLEDSCAKFRGEAELERLLARARQQEEARQRVLAIGKAAGEVQSEASRKNFDSALAMLSRALQTWPDEPSLLALQESISRDHALWKREQAVRQVIHDCEQLAAKGQFDEALRLAGRQLEQFPGEPALADLQSRLERAREEKQRADAVAAAAVRARALLEKGQLERAARHLQQSLDSYPGEAVLEELAAQVRLESERRQQREESVRDAERLLAEGRLEDAIALVTQALRSFPRDASLEALLLRGRNELEARQRTEAIAKAAADCRAMLERRAFDAALTMLGRYLSTWPEEPVLLQLQQAATEQKSAWERENALRDRIRLLEKLGRENRFAQALEAVESALRDFPDTPRLLELSEQFREGKILQDARNLIDKQLPAEALRLLQQSLSSGASSPEIQSLWETAETALRAQQRSAAIQKIADDARDSVNKGEPEAALACIDEGLKQFPREARLLEARQVCVQALEAKRRKQALEDAISELENTERRNELAAALQSTEKALAQFGNEPRLLQARQRLQAKIRAEEVRQNRLRDIEELRRIELAGRSRPPSQALEILKSARGIAERYPGDAEVRSVAAVPLEQIAAIESAQRDMAARNFAAALETCRRQLQKSPDHAAFLAIQAEAEVAQKVAFTEDLRRRVAAEKSLEARISLLEQALRQYPSESWAENELRATRNKLALAKAIAERAQAHENSERWAEALEEWNRLADLYSSYPGLDESIERVRRKREEERVAAEKRWLEQIEAELTAGDAGKAAALLSLAEVECPGSAPLRDLRRRVEAVQQGKARVRDLVLRGQSDWEQGRYPAAQANLREAYTSEYADAATRETVLNILLRYAQTAVEKDWRTAEALMAEARALDPQCAVPGKLESAIAGAKKEEFVAQCLAQAEELRKAGDALGALAEVERGLTDYPDDSRLKRLRKSLSVPARDMKAALQEELKQIRENARAAAEPAALEPLRQRAQAIAGRTQNSEIIAVAAATIDEVSARIQELLEQQRRLRAAALRKRLLISAAGVVALAAAVFGVRELLRPPNLVPLRVTTSPAGASIKAGAEVCAASPACEFKLKPGVYTLEARLDGYKPVVQEVTVKGANAGSVALVLEPLRPQVQISTNFASGTVTLDGKTAGELRNGQLTIPDLAFGRHHLVVQSPDGQAGIRIETAAGRLPSVTGKIDATDADAIAVSNLGSNLRLDCNCADGKVSVDGKPAGEISANGLELHDLTEGNKTLRVNERVLVVGVQPQPALNLFVTSNRNVGTLVIETNVQNPTVLIDKKRYPATVSQGLIRIPLNVAQYSVSLQSTGYRSSPPQTIQIQKGGAEKLVINLEPLNGALRIRGAYPGTQVSVDGKPAGTIPADQRLTIELPTGQHTIELSKQGYAVKRMVLRFQPGQTVEVSGPEAVLNPDQNTLDEARRKAEQTAWDAVNKNDRAALQKYLDQHGDSRFASDAANLVNKLEQAEKQRAEQQKREEDQRKAQQADEQRKAQQADEQRKALEAQQRKAAQDEERKKAAADALRQQQQLEAQQRAEKDAVLDLLRRYETAYRNRDANAVKAVYPDVPNFKAIVDSFKTFRSYDVKLVPSDVQISGDSAVVRCQRTIKVADQYRTQTPPPDVITIRLQKTGGQWLIASIR